MKVYNPSAGVFLLLHWSTLWRQGQVLLARTETALLKSARHIFETSNEDAEIKGHYEIELVAPPASFDERRAKYLYQEAVDNFRTHLCHCMLRVQHAGKTLPSIFAICDTWGSKYDGDDSETCDLENHYSCRNCEYKIKLVGITPEGLYETYHARWNETFPEAKPISAPSKPKPEPQESKAPVFRDDEVRNDAINQIWVAEPDFGHHAKGIVLSPLSARIENVVKNDAPLFFYRLLRTLDTSKLQAVKDEIEAKREELKEKTFVTRDEKKAVKEDKEVNGFLKFFA